MNGPSAITRGMGGTIRIGGLRAGRLAAWHVVISPTTGKPTLFGEGAFLRFYAGAVGMRAQADVMPTATPARIGRKAPPKPKPFTLTGRIAELTARSIVIAEGSIERRG